MNIDKIKLILADEPAYRMKQVWHSIFVDLIDSWDKCTTLPKVLREKLNAEAPLEIACEVFVRYFVLKKVDRLKPLLP